MRDSTLIPLAGLWAKYNDDGSLKVMSGPLGNARLVVFPNQYKKEDKHPDFNVYVQTNDYKKDKQERLPSKTQAERTATAQEGPPQGSNEINDDDIPF